MGRKTILIDLDGTILSDPTLKGVLHLGEPMNGVRDALNKLREKYYIVVYTARSNFNNEQIKAYLDYHNIIVDEVDNSKRFGAALIDDRAVQFLGWEYIDRYVNFIQSQIDKEEVGFKYNEKEKDNE